MLSDADRAHNNRSFFLAMKSRAGAALGDADRATVDRGLWVWKDLGPVVVTAPLSPMTTQQWREHAARRNAETLERIRREAEKDAS